MNKIKYIKTQDEEGEISENLFISADAVNIDLDGGENVQEKIDDIDYTLNNHENLISNLQNAIVDLQNQIAHLDLSSCEKIANKVTILSNSSTDTQYPSAKCIYDQLNGVEQALDALIGGGE